MWSSPRAALRAGLGPVVGGEWEPSPSSWSVRLQAGGSFQTSFRSTCTQTCSDSDAHTTHPGGAFWVT